MPEQQAGHKEAKLSGLSAYRGFKEALGDLKGLQGALRGFKGL